METGTKAKELTTGKLIVVVIAMGFFFGLLGYTLTTAGIAVAGATGKWVGLNLAFLILCSITFYVLQKYRHQNLKTVCTIFVIMGAAKVGEEIGKDIGTDFATTWGQWIAGGIVAAILFVGTKIISKQANNHGEQPAE